jgi:hypothetical protein
MECKFCGALGASPRRGGVTASARAPLLDVSRLARRTRRVLLAGTSMAALRAGLLASSALLAVSVPAAAADIT